MIPSIIQARAHQRDLFAAAARRRAQRPRLSLFERLRAVLAGRRLRRR